jgi:hypothetical protein
MTTGSLFVTTAVLSVCAAHWMENLHGPPESDQHGALWAATEESLLVAAMLLVLLASFALKGIVPM